MKWKKSQYNYGTSSGKKFLVILIIIVFLIGLSYYYDFMETKKYFKKIFDKGKEKLDTKNSKEFQPYTPEFKLSWCQPKNIPVDSYYTSPISINILGEDINMGNNCCKFEYQGYSVCLNKTTIVDFCTTSEIGGDIVYLKINDEFKPPQYYKEAINDLDKVYTKNRKELTQCNVNLY